jgi:hypothetical protein
MSVHTVFKSMGENVKHFADATAAVAAFGALVQILPPLASLLTIIWMGLRIFDWVEARWQGRKLSGD